MHEPTTRQLTLFGAEPQPLPAADDQADSSASAASTGMETDSGQIDLFADRVVLERDLDLAIAGGRFEEADRLCQVLRQDYGGHRAVEDLAFLERLAGPLWARPPAEALSLWAEIDHGLGERSGRRARLREGVFARLLESHTPEALAEARPECLPDVVRVLAAGPERTPGEGTRRARGLVRDALLAGRPLSSLDFRHDEGLAELLAEDVPPQWLACLGLVRRLWPAPRPDEGDLAAFRRGPAAEARSDEASAALAFWQCLRASESPDCPEPLLHEARRRMKALRPELHAAYMRRAVPR